MATSTPTHARSSGAFAGEVTDLIRARRVSTHPNEPNQRALNDIRWVQFPCSDVHTAADYRRASAMNSGARTSGTHPNLDQAKALTTQPLSLLSYTFPDRGHTIWLRVTK